MTSDEDLLRLLQGNNRVHLELVRCIRIRLATHSEAPSNTMGFVATPERSRTPASGRSIERERTQTSPYGRVVRVLEDLNPDEVETFVDLLDSYPNKPPKLFEHLAVSDLDFEEQLNPLHIGEPFGSHQIPYSTRVHTLHMRWAKPITRRTNTTGYHRSSSLRRTRRSVNVDIFHVHLVRDQSLHNGS